MCGRENSVSSSTRDPEDVPYESIALDKIPDAVLIADAATRRIVRVNRAATELFQCQRDYLLGCRQTELHPTGEADAYAEAFQRGLDNRRVNRLQSGAPLFIQTAKGQSVPVEINVELLTTGDNDYLMGIFRESSDQLARERAIKQTTNRLETLLEAIPVPVAVIDTNGVVERWNQAAEQTLGYTADSIIGESYSLFTDSAEFASVFTRVLDGEMLRNYTTTLRGKDGSRIPAVIDACPIYVDDTITGVVGTAIDSSDRQQREQQLDLLHRMTRHNLRNELSVIRGWAEVIAHRESDFEKASKKITSASDRLLELSDKVRDISRVIADEQQHVKTRSVDTVVTELSAQLRANSSVITTETAVDSATGQIRSKAGEAVYGLFDNLLRCGDDATVDLTVATADSYVRLLTTSDTPLLCEGERSLIRDGTETPLQHASGLEIARSYLTLRSIGGAVVVGADSSNAPATSLRVEIPRADA